MPTDSSTQTLTVALIGNPNTGKSTLFSALCGVRQRTGNYPGVTVEKKLGRAEFHEQHFTIVDLPGSYSLAPRSPDEMIAVDVLLGRLNVVDEPDAVLCIVDASNLERNLYLVSQVLELGKPTVIALNMVDVARDRGIAIDVDMLRKRLHVPVIEIQANRRWGLPELKQALVDTLKVRQSPPESPFPDLFQAEITKLEAECETAVGSPLPRYLVERLLLDTSGYLSHGGIREIDGSIHSAIAASRERLSAAGMPVPAVEAMARYKWIGKLLEGVVQRPSSRPKSFSDKLDRVLTHRFWGSSIFILLMVFLFQAVFWIAGPASDLIDWLKTHASTFVTA
ncbi:MAG TPA: ferrous iron transporter B, partial [Pirellulaceae bacterium]|nr:ferrous iron transporter B [Pirellulaceae bacterium]